MTFKTECHNFGWIEVASEQSPERAENLILHRKEEDTVTCIEFFENFSDAEKFAISLLEKGKINNRFLIVIRDDNNVIVWTHTQYAVQEAMREIPARYKKVVDAGKARKPSTWLNFHGYGNYCSLSELDLYQQTEVLNTCRDMYEEHLRSIGLL